MHSTHVFSEHASHLAADLRRRDWLPAVTGPAQRGYHSYRTLLATTPQQPPTPHPFPFQLLPLRRQSFHHTQRAFPLTFTVQTLIHHDFFGDPVELETVEDYRLLGFNIDLTQRTITSLTSNPPNPGKSGAQPAPVANHSPAMPHDYAPFMPTLSQRQRQMQQLNSLSTSLYVQKEHAASDCKRFLKRPKRLLSFFGAPLRGSVCV